MLLQNAMKHTSGGIDWINSVFAVTGRKIEKKMYGLLLIFEFSDAQFAVPPWPYST